MLHLAPHPELHPVFEALGYISGFLAYQRTRRSSGDVLNLQQRWRVIAAAVIGALVGSRLLGLLERIPLSQLTIRELLTPGGGKTIVGGLLGGWLGVEIAKKLSGIQARTGDVFAIPLCIGIAVGRVGCLLAGLADDTCGTPTSLPWGVNFGDGIARHPAQAYEILFLILLAIVLRYIDRLPHSEGALFRVFLAAYLAWRLLIDFLKPAPLVFGLSMLQWASVAGLLLLIASWKAAFPGAKRGATGKYA